MKFIIGLGNPGKRYIHTRHNAGFLCMDFLQQEYAFPTFTSDKKMHATLTAGAINNTKIILVKPDTFMNNSGIAVQALIHFYKLSPQDIAVIHDDLDIAPGTYKYTSSSRAAGHNGVQNIIDILQTQDIFRIRLGIGHPPQDINISVTPQDFVLQNFSSEELVTIESVFPQVQMTLERWICNPSLQ